MSSAILAALRLSDDEWRDCRESAREMSLATGRRVSPAEVAVDYVRARDAEFEALLLASGEPSTAA